jgi:hypothetical protein
MSEKKNKKPAKAKSKSEALREMREALAKDKKPEKKDKIIVMKGFDMLPPLNLEQRQEKADQIDAEVRSFDKEVNARGLRMGIMLREMRGYELWKELKSSKNKPFTSFDAWLKDAAPISRSGGYAQLKVVDKLLPLIPKEELSQYPDYARKLIAKVPKVHLEKVDSPIRKAARTAKSSDDLTRTINQHAPEAHIEHKRTIKVDASATGVITDAFAAAAAIGEVPEDEALEFLCSDWLDSSCTREGYLSMTNRQAWYAITQADGDQGEGQGSQDDQEENPDAAEAV